jgi:2-polyprenyl-6-methoxyphenol hydroxylase-like FAD-dependent oxidoreductase
MNQARQRAIVIGGSMAGLLTARVLNDYYDDVLIIERDTLPAAPDPRKGVPQSHQPHVLLLRGLDILESFFPNFADELVAAGARVGDGVAWRFVTPAGAVLPVNIGRPMLGATRPFFEWHVRQRVAALPHVHFLTDTDVIELTKSETGEGIGGVRVRYRHQRSGPEVLAADLVVDASGRSSKAVDWLQSLGYDAPPEDTVNAGVGYTSRLYRKPATFHADWDNALVQPRPPHNPRVGVLLSVEGDRWQVMLGGTTASYPPSDEAGFLAWARSLADPCIYEAIRACEPLTPIRSFRIPMTRLRHFERLARWPNGFLVVGDAVCAFNPLYAQGVTVAASEAAALAGMLRKGRLAGREQRFQRRVAQIVAGAWMLGTAEDLRWSGVLINGRPADPMTRVLYRYMDRVLAAACANAAVSLAFFKVVNMLAGPPSLMRPGIALRVLWHTLRGSTQTPAPTQQARSPDALDEVQM